MESKETFKTKWQGKSKGNVLGYRIFVFLIKHLGVRSAYLLLVFVALYYFLSQWTSNGYLYRYFRHRLGYTPLRAVVSVYRNYYVFVLPVEEELDLKKCAKSVGVKSLSMIHVKDINKVTGYVRGGCTAIGMKKRYVTRIDDSARKLPRMIVSGGRLGTQMELKPEDLCQAAGAEFASLT